MAIDSTDGIDRSDGLQPGVALKVRQIQMLIGLADLFEHPQAACCTGAVRAV